MSATTDSRMDEDDPEGSSSLKPEQQSKAVPLI